MVGKKIKEKFDSGIILTNNEMKDIMKVIKSFENREILIKGTTTKITSQEKGFLNFLRPLITAGLPLIKIVLTSLVKSVLIPLVLSTEMSSADADIQKKIYGSGTTVLIISNKEIENIMKIVKSLEESGLLIKGMSETMNQLDSFGAEHIPKEIRKFIGNKSIINIYRMQAYNSIM